MNPDPSPTDGRSGLGRVRRWEDLGGIWRVLDRHPDQLTISLCRCDGGEEVERFSSSEPSLLGFIGDRDTSEV
ncbi:hypothetical protein FOE78_11000 [Microlunatus elymi]|uniref:Uncharacterized protein n=1 Tax=Microlunatus elymi TaxID=2596828 RepID=A0A516Q5M2_9ACTN|nr:hypothetical protein FOE78_11000 [Microlunatus elymi]